MLAVGFPTGRDSATFQDSGTGKTFLYRDKGTTGQKFLHCPGTKGQLDKFKILPQGRKFDVLLGQDFDSMSLPGISWDSHGNEREKEFKKLQF